MELTNGEICNAYEPLKTLIGKKFPIKVSYALAKLAQRLTPQMDIVRELREKLYITYGEKDPKDPFKMLMSPTSEKFPQFAKELGELLEQTCEVEFEVVKLPSIEQLVCPKCKNILAAALEIEPTTLILLEKFIEVEVEPKK